MKPKRSKTLFRPNEDGLDRQYTEVANMNVKAIRRGDTGTYEYSDDDDDSFGSGFDEMSNDSQSGKSTDESTDPYMLRALLLIKEIDGSFNQFGLMQNLQQRGHQLVRNRTAAVIPLHVLGTDEFVSATQELSILCWLGGKTVQNHIINRSFIGEWNVKLQSDVFPPKKKVAIFNLIGELVRESPENRSQLGSHGWIQLFLDHLEHIIETVRRAALNALFLLLLNHGENQTTVLEAEGLFDKLNGLADLLWEEKGWNYNVAEEVMKLLDMY